MHVGMMMSSALFAATFSAAATAIRPQDGPRYQPVDPFRRQHFHAEGFEQVKQMPSECYASEFCYGSNYPPRCFQTFRSFF